MGFPRVAIFSSGALMFIAMPFLETPGRVALLPLLVIPLVLQLRNISPYTPLALQQAQLTGDERERHCITILRINVYMHNR